MKYIIFKTSNRNSKFPPTPNSKLKEKLVYEFDWDEDESFYVWEIELGSLGELVQLVLNNGERIVLHSNCFTLWELPNNYSDQMCIEIYDSYRE